MSRQLKALKKTFKLMQRKAEKGKKAWFGSGLICPLCSEFSFPNCVGCPANGSWGKCGDFAEDYYGETSFITTPLSDTMSIIYQMILYYEEV